MNIKESIKKLVQRYGYTIYRNIEVSGKMEFEPVRPKARYSPWNLNEPFKKVYNQIRPYTMVDIYKCYELWLLIDQCRKIEGAIMEVGVWRGGSGALIAARARVCGIQDTVYLCDTFKGVPKVSPHDLSYKGGEHSNASRGLVEDLISKKMKLDNVQILEGVFPDDTCFQVKDSVFRFCHLDVDTYLSAKDIVSWIWDKMPPGGMIVYDDYGFEGCNGITKYVDEQRDDKDKHVIHNLNGHAIVVKLK